MPIHVKNKGLITDNYTIRVTSSNPSVISVTQEKTRIEGIRYGETGDAYATLTLKLVSPATITISATSEVSEVYANAISQVLNINVQGQLISLDEFGFVGIIQIILIFGLVVLVKFKS